MARRILSIGAGVALGACQVGPIEVVECGINADCAAEQYCELPSHRCVPFTRSSGSEQPEQPVGLTAMAIDWTGTGQVVGSENPLGLNGTWWLHDDCSLATPAIAAGTLVCPAGWSTPSCCTEYDTSLTGPAPENHPGLTITPAGAGVAARACIKGTLTRVVTDSADQARYDVGWGIAFELPFSVLGAFDGTRAFPGGTLVGFMLDIDGPPLGPPLRIGIRGEADEAYFVEFPVPAKNAQLLFSEAQQGDWVTPRLPLERSALQGLHLSIGTNPDAALPFDFCVSNLRALQQPAASN